MKKIIDEIKEVVTAAFENAGYDKKYSMVTVSNRPDLCQYQCNGALAAAKEYKKAPIMIAGDVIAKLVENNLFSKVEAVMPGFININLSDSFIANYIKNMGQDEKLGCDSVKNPEKIVIDYGGPNVAKPLHVGHLRSAVIGESVKRINKFMGHDVTGDVHLGDWGLQMGLIITELKKRKPDLIYFDETYTGEYPSEPPFTISELEEIYPAANAYSKEHPEFKEEAKNATFLMQNGNRGYIALWKHILNVSVADLKRNYEKLNVSFEMWGKESDAQQYIPDMVKYMKDEGYAHISEGALVVDVKEDTDTKDVPPCMILKSDGATLYNTTDLATIVQRQKMFNPDKIIYVADKRQSLYFEQVFRCAKKTKIIGEKTKLIFLGFGTMNGKDGKPFKTRDGGVMRLEHLIKEINDAVYEKVKSNRDIDDKSAHEIADKVSISALKYGDLSNQSSKDYIFDIDRFISFEGNTGPYILYTIVRIKSILAKLNVTDKQDGNILPAHSESERNLMLALTKFNEVIYSACDESAPHKICQFIYELSDAFNKFYHENRIISQEDEDVKNSWTNLLIVTKDVLEKSIDLLGFEAPDRM